MAVQALELTNQESRFPMSAEEFLAWADENVHAEWVDGEVIVFMTAKDKHQGILDFIYRLLGFFIDLNHSGKIRTAPFAMKLQHGRSYREPDLLFISQANLSRLTNDWLDGPADLVAEIISDESVYRDRDEKFKEYQDAGIPEYWIIDPREGKQRADFFGLNDAGVYELLATEDSDRFESRALPGFWLKPAWLWQVDEIDPLAALFEMRGISQEQAQAVRELLRGDGPLHD